MTAVEWLEEELKANLKKVILEGDSELMESLFEQAKEMEKEQSLKIPPYDLKELADEYADVNGDYDGYYGHIGFKAGFQKALELLTFKSE